MEETLSLIGSYGGLVILAALFVWSYFKNQTKSDEMLSRIDKSNENIAKSIDAINNTTDILKEYIIKHDERTKRVEENTDKILDKMNEK